MRRWNGWGDTGTTQELPDRARRLLGELVGEPRPPRDVTFDSMVAAAPASRLPEHPLVRRDPEERLRHARGQSLGDWISVRTGLGLTLPDGVAHPPTPADVRELLVHASKVGAKIIPYGGGTSVAGHINPSRGEAPVLTVALDRLSGLHDLDSQSQLATFGAGTAGPAIEEALAQRGYTLGHFPQSFELSTLGGWVVTRSAGQQSMRYGRIESLFAGGRLEAPAGTLELPAFPASAAGPDLREVVLGSEGRLGILTEATVRISPLPELEEFHAICFPDWPQALEAARQIAQARLPLSMVRVSTGAETATSLALAGRAWLVAALDRFLAWRGAGPDKCIAFVGATGRKALARAALKEVGLIAGDCGGVHLGQTMGAAWKKNRFKAPYLRNVLWEMGYAVDTLETATTWTAVDPTVADIESALRSGIEDVGERVHVFSHLSHLYPTGANIYTTYLFRIAADPEETLRRWQALKAAASHAIVERGATITHQHGIGVDHRPYLEAEKGELGIGAIEGIVAHFDPGQCMNPGKLVD